MGGAADAGFISGEVDFGKESVQPGLQIRILVGWPKCPLRFIGVGDVEESKTIAALVDCLMP